MNHSTLLSVRSLSLVIAEMYFRRVCLTQVLHILLLNLVFFFPVFYQNCCQARLFFMSGILCYVKIFYLMLLTMDSKGFVDFLC